MRITSTCLLALVACGGGDELTALEGIYTVNAWTQNSTACDAEGPSVLEINEPFFYIKNESLLGSKFVNVNPCNAIGECQADATDADTIHIGRWGFEDGSDSAGWTLDNAFAFEVEGTCEAFRSTVTMTATGDSIRIEDRSSRGTYAPTNGECPDDEALAATASAPCESLEVVTATFDSDF